jgi:hypothetical protein
MRRYQKEVFVDVIKQDVWSLQSGDFSFRPDQELLCSLSQFHRKQLTHYHRVIRKQSPLPT